MDRRTMLRLIGAFGLVSILARVRRSQAAERGAAIRTVGCWFTPQKTEGPFYFDPDLLRQDITEGKPGLPLRLVIQVVDRECQPAEGVLVDVWHCDKDGLYSGYQQPGGNTVGQTFLRGSALTDGSGSAVVDTIYPGWYQGRATHIHFKVRLDESTFVTSQFAFPEEVNAAVYASSLYVGRGANSTSNAADSIFQSSTPQYLLLAVTPEGTGYLGDFTIGVDAVIPTEKRSWGELKNAYRRVRSGPSGPTTGEESQP